MYYVLFHGLLFVTIICYSAACINNSHRIVQEPPIRRPRELLERSVTKYNPLFMKEAG